MLLKNIILVGLGGMLGSILRYLADHFISHERFPYSTLLVNVLGSFVIGAIMGIAGRQDDFGNWRLFLATGVCGGFTTFSALAWQNLQLLNQQRYTTFIIYTGSSLVLGLLAVFLGYTITK
ncbi:MAG: fluoride efflux transporter CrcB [Chitinophagaceae bacterium]|nr:fluoride efflux transporter CrcB [Chitinophagaceae bacterium]